MPEGKFIESHNPKLQELVEHILDQVHLIITSELAQKSQSPPRIKDVIINEYMVIMQVCSLAMMEIIHATAKSTDMVSQVTPDEASKFMKMTDDERFAWAKEKFGDVFHEKKRDRSDYKGT